ncbi:hypothetical protein MHZ36_00680 [Staphylococcus sp. ACRSN]|uniref:hypothetical protein n=1 Tax=Staphylococcus sp. ACRSN TaxID=2918214 RepID=UPI001EF26753|nr:hypothetical protein [Staphylococcus sp. ACRSN]MCG7337792.1 hypothetical protein [Staphylococcus sp. ACRSN]
MLKYVVMQYIRQKESKLSVYLQRYFIELEPYALLFVKSSIWMNIISLIVAVCMILFVPINAQMLLDKYSVDINDLNFQIFILSFLIILITKLTAVLISINKKTVINKRSFYLNMIYKIIFGQEYLASIILILCAISRFYNVWTTLLLLIFILIIVRCYHQIFINSAYIFFTGLCLYNVAIFFSLNIESRIWYGGEMITLIAICYHLLVNKAFNTNNRKSQLIIFNHIFKVKYPVFLNVPVLLLIGQYLAISLPKALSISLTQIQFIGYILLLYCISIITIQIQNPILINIDWYANFVKYTLKPITTEVDLLKILERNNLIILISMAFVFFIESIYLFNHWLWWLFPLLFLIWHIDSAFSLYSFKILSISQRENLRQHTKKQLPYIFLIGISIMLITTKNISYHLTNKLTIVTFISYILLVVLAIIFKKEGKTNFKNRIEANIHD